MPPTQEKGSARRCTDSGWILNLILVWTLVAVIAVASVGLIPSNFIQAGSKLRLYGLMDYRGNFCGVSDEVKSLPFLWRPNAGGSNYNSKLEIVPTDFGICIESCPKFDEGRSDPYIEIDPNGALGSWRSEQATIDVAGVCQDVHSSLQGDIWRSVWVDIDLVWGAIVLGSTVLPLGLFAVLMAVYLSCFGHSSNCMNWVVRGLMWQVLVVLLGGGSVCIYNSFHKDMTIFGDGSGGEFDATSHKNNHIPKSSVEIVFQRATGLIMLGASVLWMLMMSTVSPKRIATALDLLYSLILLVREEPVLLFPPLLGLYLLVELTYYTYFFGIHIASSSSVATSPLFPNATAADYPPVVTVNTTTNVTTVTAGVAPQYQCIVYDENIEPYLYMLFALFCWSGWIVNAFTQLVMSNLVWKWYGLIEAKTTGSVADTGSEGGGHGDGDGDGVSELSEDGENEDEDEAGAGSEGASHIGVGDVYRSYVLVMSNHIGTAACGSVYIHAFFPLRLVLRPALRLYLRFCAPPKGSAAAGGAGKKGPVPLSIRDNDDDDDVETGDAGGGAQSDSRLLSGAKYLACCCGCYLLRRLFRVLKVQSNNAYVICAYKGHDFKKSSVHAEKLLKKFMNKGKYILNNLQMVLFIVSSAICLTSALVAYACLYYAELQTLHEFISIPWIIAIVSFFVINLWFQTMYILLSTLMIAYIVDEQVDFGRGARRLPVLHLMFVQLYNHRYEQLEADTDEGPVVPTMEDMGARGNNRGRGGGGSHGGGVGGSRRLGMHSLLVEEPDSDTDSDHEMEREMEALVGDHSFGSGDGDLIAEYIGVQDRGSAMFVYTPMSNEDKMNLSSLSSNSVSALRSLGVGAGKAPTLNMMKMFNRSHGISAEQANAYMPTDVESVCSDHSGFEMSMRSNASDDVASAAIAGPPHGSGRSRGSMMFKLQSIPELSRSESSVRSSNSSLSSVKSKSMAYV